jgi:hypothetical protein
VSDLATLSRPAEDSAISDLPRPSGFSEYAAWHAACYALQAVFRWLRFLGAVLRKIFLKKCLEKKNVP